MNAMSSQAFYAYIFSKSIEKKKDSCYNVNVHRDEVSIIGGMLIETKR